MANINLETGILVTTQIPLDAKGYFLTTAGMQDLGASNYKAFYYYEGMVVMNNETKREYIWRERTVADGLEGTSGVLATDFVYPNGSIANTIDYSARAFNFFIYTGGISIADIPEIELPEIDPEIDPIFSGTKGYMLVVRNDEQALQLRPVAHIPLPDPYNCSVRKGSGNTNVDILEIGDIVYWKEIDEGGFITELIGYTYNGPDPELLTSYSLERTIAT